MLISFGVFSQSKNTSKIFIIKLLFTSGTPALSMVLFGEKGIASSLAVGVKDQSTSQPIDEYIVFSAASLSKPIFAYLVLKLAAEGKIDLDKSLFQYMPVSCH